MNAQLEMAKSKAVLQNIITSIRSAEEGKAEIDILGSVLVLADQLDRLDDAIEESNV